MRLVKKSSSCSQEISAFFDRKDNTIRSDDITKKDN